MEQKNAKESNLPNVSLDSQSSAPTGNTVSALVAKSKKAACSLFTLLHAKVRPLYVFASFYVRTDP